MFFQGGLYEKRSFFPYPAITELGTAHRIDRQQSDRRRRCSQPVRSQGPPFSDARFASRTSVAGRRALAKGQSLSPRGGGRRSGRRRRGGGVLFYCGDDNRPPGGGSRGAHRGNCRICPAFDLGSLRGSGGQAAQFPGGPLPNQKTSFQDKVDCREGTELAEDGPIPTSQ